MKKIAAEHISLAVLIVLSILGAWFSRFAQKQILIQLIITITIIIKGQQIVDVFMELRHAPAKWRRIMIAYVIVVPSLLFIITLF